MTDLSVDIAILGAGSAGLAAHAAAHRHTDSLLLIDPGPHGTTCARVGCMPSKLLLAAAEARRQVDEAHVFGIVAPVSSVDGAAVMRRVQQLRDRFVGSVLDAVQQIPPAHRLLGEARFIAPQTLQVGPQRIAAKRVVIATGSAPVLPATFQARGDRVLTTDTVFELPRLPESLAIVGGGVIGLELGQAFHTLGVATRLLHRGTTLGPAGDPAITSLATELFSASLPCTLGVTDVQVTAHSAQDITLSWTDAEQARHTQRFQHVLVCTGRQPRLQSLDLARSGLALDKHGVPLFDPATLRCGQNPVFIAGDANDDQPLLHQATEQGRIAGDGAARWPEPSALHRSVPLAIAFTTPQFATIGDGLEKLEPSDTAVGEVSFADQGRARVINRNAGLGRLYASRQNGRLLGAQLLGPAAEHLAHLLAWAVQQRLTVGQLLDMPFYHPVIEEGLRTALKDLRRQIGAPRDMAPPHQPKVDCMDCGPGT